MYLRFEKVFSVNIERQVPTFFCRTCFGCPDQYIGFNLTCDFILEKKMELVIIYWYTALTILKGKQMLLELPLCTNHHGRQRPTR